MKPTLHKWLQILIQFSCFQLPLISCCIPLLLISFCSIFILYLQKHSFLIFVHATFDKWWIPSLLILFDAILSNTHPDIVTIERSNWVWLVICSHCFRFNSPLFRNKTTQIEFVEIVPIGMADIFNSFLSDGIEACIKLMLLKVRKTTCCEGRVDRYYKSLSLSPFESWWYWMLPKFTLMFVICSRIV